MKTLFILAIAMFFSPSHAQWYGDAFGSDGRKASEFSRSEGLTTSSVKEAVVLQVRPVSLESSGAARAAGTAVGAGIGAHVSRFSSSYAARGVAVGLGGLVGALTAGEISRDGAIEVLVRLKDSSLLAVVQGVDADSSAITPGVNVALINTQGKTRVVRIFN